MTTVLLVRHGLTATTGQVLTGWTPGVGLDDRGRAQARALGARIAPVPLDAVVTSPLDRCRADGGRAHRGGDRPPGPAAPVVDDRVGECRYGDWTGKPLAELAKDPLWPVVQAHPSAVRFPGAAGSRCSTCSTARSARSGSGTSGSGKDATYLVCSHGDVIKAIVADSLGLHLDQSQRIIADPCSLTVINYTPMRPFLLRLNDTGGGVADLLPSAKQPSASSDAVIGGGAGTSPQPQPSAAGPTEGNEIGPAENEGAEVESSKNKAAEVGARTDADGAEG